MSPVTVGNLNTDAPAHYSPKAADSLLAENPFAGLNLLKNSAQRTEPSESIESEETAQLVDCKDNTENPSQNQAPSNPCYLASRIRQGDMKALLNFRAPWLRHAQLKIA